MLLLSILQRLRKMPTTRSSASAPLSNILTEVPPVPTKKRRKHVKIEYSVDEKPMIKNENGTSSTDETVTSKPKKNGAAPKPKASASKTKLTKPEPDSEAKVEANGSAEQVKSEYWPEEEKPGKKWEPPHWKEVLANIQEMRKNTYAPVDDMGCDKNSSDNAPPEVKRFHVLISLMLSSQTKDQVTHAAVERLIEHNGCTVDSIIALDEEALGKLIYPVGFWKTKAKNIKKACEILKKDYKSDIPNTIKDLCSLPGVGPKMAHLAMNCGWGIVTGIGVDTHVHRISNWLPWVQKPTKTPEDTRLALEAWLPRDLWSEVNHLLVGFGQSICKPNNPQCSQCLNNQLCKIGRAALRGEKPWKNMIKKKKRAD